MEPIIADNASAPVSKPRTPYRPPQKRWNDSSPTSRRSPSSPAGRGGSRTPCRFGANCNRKDTCHFVHPAAVSVARPYVSGPCRYGADCRRKDTCKFSHPAPPPRSGPPGVRKKHGPAPRIANDAASVMKNKLLGWRSRVTAEINQDRRGIDRLVFSHLQDLQTGLLRRAAEKADLHCFLTSGDEMVLEKRSF